jgi:hypothetical protein
MTRAEYFGGSHSWRTALRINDGNLWIKGTQGYEPFFNKSRLVVVREMAQLRTMSVAGYVWEVVDAELAQCRLQRITPDFLQARGAADTCVEKIEVRGRQQLTAERVQKVLHLRDTYVSPSAIAQRLSISLVSVHRILRENDETKISVPHAAIVSCRAVHDARPEGSLVGFWPRIESRRKKSA